MAIQKKTGILCRKMDKIIFLRLRIRYFSCGRFFVYSAIIICFNTFRSSESMPIEKKLQPTFRKRISNQGSVGSDIEKHLYGSSTESITPLTGTFNSWTYK